MLKKSITIATIFIFLGAIYLISTRNTTPEKADQNNEIINQPENINISKLKTYQDDIAGYKIKYPANWYIGNIDPNHGYLAIQSFQPGSRGYDVGKVISKDDLIIHFWAFRNIENKTLDAWLEDRLTNPFGERIELSILSKVDLSISGAESIKREENDKGDFYYYIPHKDYILMASYGPNPSNLESEFEKIIENIELY